MNKHETDLFSLIFGVAFLVAVATWLIAQIARIGWLSIGWVLASGLIVIGLVGIFSAVRPLRNR